MPDDPNTGSMYGTSPPWQASSTRRPATDDFPSLAPRPVDMVHQLHTALYGGSWARPESPAKVWADLLAEVRQLKDDVKVGDRARRLLAALYEAEAQDNKLLRAGIAEVLADSETGAGGWGPDVTMAHVLRSLLNNDTEKPEPMVAESSWDSLADEMSEVEAERDRLREGIRVRADQWDREPMALAFRVAADFRSLLDDEEEASEDSYVSLYDYHVDGCTFTTEEGWQCLLGCPSLEAPT